MSKNRFSDLIGKTLTAIASSKDEIIFECLDATYYVLHHHQNCCENVYVEDIIGDAADLLGTPIVLAELITNKSKVTEDTSCTWSFYKLATAKGYVTIRWYGESNGYYSEEVSFELLKKEEC